MTQHLYWQLCTPSSHWRILFAIFMLIAPLIRQPGRVVSTGRALVPTQPNFNDLFIFFATDYFIVEKRVVEQSVGQNTLEISMSAMTSKNLMSLDDVRHLFILGCICNEHTSRYQLTRLAHKWGGTTIPLECY
jgi:hypothetical protein